MNGHNGLNFMPKTGELSERVIAVLQTMTDYVNDFVRQYGIDYTLTWPMFLIFVGIGGCFVIILANLISNVKIKGFTFVLLVIVLTVVFAFIMLYLGLSFENVG